MSAGRVFAAGLAAASLVGGLWWLGAQEPEAEVEPRPAVRVAPSPVPSEEAAAAVPAAEARALPRPAATPPAPVAARPVSPEALPYRFVGRVMVDGEQALVFFGRGRTVRLLGPGPLDEEYAIDAILERQVLLRHVPTSSSRFVDLAVSQVAAAPAMAPADSPAD